MSPIDVLVAGPASWNRIVQLDDLLLGQHLERLAGRFFEASAEFGGRGQRPLARLEEADHAAHVAHRVKLPIRADYQVNLAIRVAPGPLRGNQLMARKIGESAVAVVASPDYLARHGEPKTPAELAKHNLIGFNFARSVEGWPFRVDGALISIAAVGNTQVGDGEIARQLAVAGIGLARLGRFHTQAEVAAGRLVTVLEDFNPGDIEVIHAVYLGQGGFVPARMRAFIDFLLERLNLEIDYMSQHCPMMAARCEHERAERASLEAAAQEAEADIAAGKRILETVAG